MASTSVLKLLFLLALIATSCMAQAPSGAPTLSPTATPVAAPPIQTPSPSPGPAVASPTAGGEATPSPAPGAASPNSPSPAAATPGPAADQTPAADGSNGGYVSRAAVGGTALAAALVAVAML
ncbi:hypothetical protein ACP275_12G016400 [Erythranthe tilingii]